MRQFMHIEQVNTDTGEVMQDHVLALIPKRSPHPYGTRWIAMNQDPTTEIAKMLFQGALGKRDAGVLMMAIAKLDFENFISFSQADAAREYAVDASDLNRSLGKLVKLGLVLKGPKVGRALTYRLNPHFGWKGSKKNLAHELKSRFRLVTGGKD